MSCTPQGQLRLLLWGQLSRFFSWPVISIFVPGGSDGFQLASSPSFCPYPRLRAFSVCVSGLDTHQTAPNLSSVLPLESHFKVSEGAFGAAQFGAYVASTFNGRRLSHWGHYLAALGSRASFGFRKINFFFKSLSHFLSVLTQTHS